MLKLIKMDTSACVGCNRCIRLCPVPGANIAYSEGEEIKVKVDHDHCIVCGACIDACQHGARDYCDDTERFLADLRAGVPISLFAAPANRTYGESWGRLLSWLRREGVRMIYDVSLGADICTWAHIRYIQKENPPSIITQPCPAIVNYILNHQQDLLPYLSPIHSPMLCTAIFMKKYEGVNDKIAALSPCIAKACEFEATQFVEYNVTLKKLYEYLDRKRIVLPQQESGFDHQESSLGCLYSMPGGLKENVELYLGKTLRIDKSEGQEIVYKALQEFSEQSPEFYPAIFDVLNCQEGCNLGTGVPHERSILEVNTIMDNARQQVLQNRDEADFEALYEEYDRTLQLKDFIRQYTAGPDITLSITPEQIEEAFVALEKAEEKDRKFDCSACGADTCLDMAKFIAWGLNIPANCIQKVRSDVHQEHDALLELSSTNLSNIRDILVDISEIRKLTDDITNSVSGVNTSITKYSNMAKEIERIALQINIISLNASIEAARAGEHGKAFGVVATEIRKLANSSQKTVAETEQIATDANVSIKEINTMVDHIGSEVEKAYQNISDISETTQSTLNKADNIVVGKT